MSNAHLITMANQIGQFFEANGEHIQDAIEHIQKFWPPSMRQNMAQLLNSNQAEQLSPFMRKTFESLIT